ncbi:MAG: hypothetical protein AB1472_03820 [Candidatus Omnitrophota bacterium]
MNEFNELIEQLKKAGYRKYEIIHVLEVSYMTLWRWSRSIGKPAPGDILLLENLLKKKADKVSNCKSKKNLKKI